MICLCGNDRWRPNDYNLITRCGIASNVVGIPNFAAGPRVTLDVLCEPIISRCFWKCAVILSTVIRTACTKRIGRIAFRFWDNWSGVRNFREVRAIIYAGPSTGPAFAYQESLCKKDTSDGACETRWWNCQVNTGNIECDSEVRVKCAKNAVFWIDHRHC